MHPSVSSGLASQVEAYQTAQTQECKENSRLQPNPQYSLSADPKALMPPKSRSKVSGTRPTSQSVATATRNKISSREFKSLGIVKDTVVSSPKEGTNDPPVPRLRTRAQIKFNHAPETRAVTERSKTVNAVEAEAQTEPTALKKSDNPTSRQTKRSSRTKASKNADDVPKLKKVQAAKQVTAKKRASGSTKKHQTNQGQTRSPAVPAPGLPVKSPEQSIYPRHRGQVHEYIHEDQDHGTFSSLGRIYLPSSPDIQERQRWRDPDEDYYRDRALNFEVTLSDIYSMPVSGRSTPLGRQNAAKQVDGNGSPKVVKARPEEKDFDEGLLDRNVAFSSQKDPHDETNKYKELVESQNEIPEGDPESEQRWKDDLTKCKRSLEAIFQHTAMMEAIDRHNLNAMFDYACEAEWTSPPPPYDELARVVLPAPKSDLIIGFKGDLLVRPSEVKLLGPLKERMFPESMLVNDDARAFPFLAFEVKGRNGDLGDKVALRQMLNTATVALHNIWKFIEGIAELQERFFKEIRFFTATGNSEYFNVYMHWAVEVATPDNSTPGDGSTAKPVVLEYYHEALKPLKGTQYTRVRVVHMIQKILHYGETHFLKFLKEAIPLAVERQRLRRSAVIESIRLRRALQENQAAAKRRQSSTSAGAAAQEASVSDTRRASSSVDQVRGRARSLKRRPDDDDGTVTERNSVEPERVRQSKKNNARGLGSIVDETIQVSSGSLTSSAAGSFVRQVQEVDLNSSTSEA